MSSEEKMFFFVAEGKRTTGDAPFAVCQGHTVKPQKPTANPLPCAAHGNQASAKPAFAVCYISGTRQRVCCVPLSTHGKKK